jgi:hypothetical protein
MLLRGEDAAGSAAAERERSDRGQTDPLVDYFAPLCAEAEALCRRLDPGLRRIDGLCAGLGELVGRLTAGRSARPRSLGRGPDR